MVWVIPHELEFQMGYRNPKPGLDNLEFDHFERAKLTTKSQYFLIQKFFKAKELNQAS